MSCHSSLSASNKKQNHDAFFLSLFSSSPRSHQPLLKIKTTSLSTARHWPGDISRLEDICLLSPSLLFLPPTCRAFQSHKHFLALRALNCFISLWFLATLIVRKLRIPRSIAMQNSRNCTTCVWASTVCSFSTVK